MLKFWIQKFLFRFSFAVSFCLFIGVFAYAYLTEIINRPPDVTDQAPFAETVLSDSQMQQNPFQEVPADKPHRTERELQTWIERVIPDALNFDGQNYQDRLESVRPYFTPAGYTQYRAFIDSAGMVAALKERSLRAGAFLTEAPQLIQGYLAGSIYHWSYEIPVTISYVPNRTFNYQTDAVQPVNKDLLLRITVGRSTGAAATDDLQIESWAVSARRN